MKRPLDNSDNGSKENPIVFLDVALDGERVGRLVIELFKDVVPKTAENFRALCTGEKGIGVKGKKLHYKGSFFHRVVPHFMIQGGDIVNFNGTSGESIYGPYFEDENFDKKHTKKGLLSMVNEGKPDTNSSQFIISTEQSSHLNETNVVFGEVLRGFGAVQELNEVEIVDDRPIEKIQIIDCGELKKGENWGLCEKDGTADIYPNWPEDWDYCLDTDEERIDHKYISKVIEKIKESGNHHFSRKKYVTAGRKYSKAMRYCNWLAKTKNLPEDLEVSLSKLKISIELNLAAVHLRTNKYKEALQICDLILSTNRNHCKALFRRSQAYMGLNEYKLSLSDLELADSLSPNNPDIIRERKKVKQTIQSYLTVEKASFKRMLQLS